ncbi:anionic trypsin-like [Macrobrachium nipponense]|uniref:anionic trypsin-like n=1 Tax=Macrobrachium nipponense TaxID=159736 RepID=UPI0030C80BA3
MVPRNFFCCLLLTATITERFDRSNALEIGLLANTSEVIPPKSTNASEAARPRSNVSEILPTNCGLAAQSRIVGGIESESMQWPWIVSVRFAWGQHFCGGFLVTESHVITAAHCVSYFSNLPQHLRIAAGTTKAEEEVIVATVKAINIHPSFGNTSAFDSDVAVLELAQPFKFDLLVAPVCLPKKDASVGQPVVAVGWGKTSEEEESFSPVLNHVEIKVLEMEKCSSSYENLFNENMICAGSLERSLDSCLGDSGGPLLAVGSDGSWQALAVISFGKGCGNPNFPGVYTNLYRFTDWLHEVFLGK